MFSLAVKKLFILMKSHLFIISFMSLALGDISVKICCMEYLRFSCLCSPLGLLWHHDLYLNLLSILSSFLCVVYVGGRISCFACSCPDLPTPFVEKAIFYSILCFCLLCQILVDHRDFGLSLGSLFSSIDLCVCSYARTRLF